MLSDVFLFISTHMLLVVLLR